MSIIRRWAALHTALNRAVRRAWWAAIIYGQLTADALSAAMWGAYLPPLDDDMSLEEWETYVKPINPS